MGYQLKSGKEIHPTSFSSGALDSLAAVLNILGVNETEMEPEDLGSGTGFSNNSLFLSMNEGAKAIRYIWKKKREMPKPFKSRKKYHKWFIHQQHIMERESRAKKQIPISDLLDNGTMVTLRWW